MANLSAEQGLRGACRVEREGARVVLHVECDVPLAPGGKDRPVSLNPEAADRLINELIDAMIAARAERRKMAGGRA